MAYFHSRSNSLPSQSHPVMYSVEEHLCRLKSSEGASTSVSSICADLATLSHLHKGINDMIQMPSFQQALSQEHDSWINELLEGSLKLVDLCGYSRDVASLTKESVQELESSIRRNKVETPTTVDMNTYAATRKKINKIVNKCLKNLKSFNLNSTTISNSIGTMLKEMESRGLSVLKSVLILLSGEKERSSHTSWSFLSKLTQKSRIHSEAEQECGVQDLCFLNIIKSQKSIDSTTVKNILKQSEMTIQEVEEELESLFRSLVKTRVSLLNLLSH